MQFKAFPAPETIEVAGRSVPLLLVPNLRSRRYVLRVRPDGVARVTVPRRGSLRAARDFARRNLVWLEKQLQRVAAAQNRDTSWKVGSEILFRGERVMVSAAAGTSAISLGNEMILVADLRGDLRPELEKRMRALATAELPPRVFELARQHGLTVRRVTVRGQRSRWGSCSPRGAISLNWRLIQASPSVSDYIILHELMHLREMNHSRRFWRHVESVCPGFRDAERWLRGNSALLRP